MNKCKRYEIKRGHVLYREELEFRTILHEIIWKLTMRRKGCIVKEFLSIE